MELCFKDHVHCILVYPPEYTKMRHMYVLIISNGCSRWIPDQYMLCHY